MGSLFDNNNRFSHKSHKWGLGTCSSPNFGEFALENDKVDVYVDQCCLTPGRFVLTCQNDKGPFGWGNSSVEIQGQKYCNDFIGSKARRIIMITGTVLIRSL